MSRKVWYEIWIIHEGIEEIIIKVKSQGLANWLVLKLSDIYDNIEVR